MIKIKRINIIIFLVSTITLFSLSGVFASTATSANDWNWEYDIWVEHLAHKYNIEVSLIMGIIKAESGFKYMISHKGAVGFMQLMPNTAKQMGAGDIYDPVENLKYGVKYFKMMLDKYKNIPLALAAYNAGPGAVQKYGSIPPYPETIDFVFKVMRYSDDFKYNNNDVKKKKIQ